MDNVSASLHYQVEASTSRKPSWEMMARIISSYGPAHYRRTTTGPVLQTLILPRVTAEYQPGKLATTETRQPCTRGSLRVTRALGASGPERVTAFAPTRTATAVAGTARPFTMVSVAAERRSFGRAAEALVGAGAVGAGKATGGTEGELGS